MVVIVIVLCIFYMVHIDIFILTLIILDFIYLLYLGFTIISNTTIQIKY